VIIMDESEFKFIKGAGLVDVDVRALAEIAYQLKRIADRLDAVRISPDGGFSVEKIN
jgi:hypothetical protein